VNLAPLIFTTLFTKAVNKTLVGIENEMILEIFNCQKLQGGENKSKTHQISIFGLECVPIYIRGMIQVLYLIFSL
jgi:hypothetical protein